MRGRVWPLFALELGFPELAHLLGLFEELWQAAAGVEAAVL